MLPSLTGAPEWRGSVVLGAGVVAAAGVAAGAATLLGPAALALGAALVAVAFLVREPLALLSALLWVGIFKRQSILEALPFDITAALAVLLAGVCFWRWLSGRSRPLPFGLLALLGLVTVWLAVSLAWTPVSDYGADKLARFGTFTLVAALAPFFLIEGRRDLRAFMAWTFAFGLLTAALTLVSPPSTTGDRLGLGEGEGKSTIFAARLLCTAALVGLLGVPLIRSAPTKLVVPVSAVGMIGVALAIGSRGPVLAFVLTLACTLVAQAFRGVGRLAPVLVTVVVAVGTFQFVDLPETSAERLGSTAQDPIETVKAEGRGALYSEAVEVAGDNPLRGVGVGGFAAYTSVIASGVVRYPHNIVLELAAETGLIPAAALLLATIFVLGRLYSRALRAEDRFESQLLYLAAALLLMNFLAAQFSGDLNDNRSFFAFLSLGWLATLLEGRRAAGLSAAPES